ncbi:MAG: hypothetical protein LBH67_02725 [Rickettsia sp.]|jgi:hypothetical protein|nr:hypothetical protein [Rickettsia sp.]
MPLSLFNKTSPESKKAKQEHFKKKVSNLFQEYGNTQAISTPFDKEAYKVLKKEYDPLLNKIEDTQSLFELNKSLAIIALRAGQDASTYLKMWEKTNINSSDFITELQTILEGRIKFLQETGNITKINTPLDSSEYKSNNIIRDNLVKTIKESPLSGEIRAKLSFELNKCQAISVFRAGQNASTYLKGCGSLSASRNEFIIELYKVLTNMQNSELVVQNIYKQIYYPLVQQALNAVDSHLKTSEENYVAAFNEITPLVANCNIPKVLAKYVEICIKEGTLSKLEQCWKVCTETIVNRTKEDKVLAKIFGDLQKKFKQVSLSDDKAIDQKTKLQYSDLTDQAGERAKQHSPQPQIQETAAPVSREEEIACKELEKAKEKAKQAITQVVTTEARVAEIKVEQQYKAKLEAKTAKVKAELDAEREQNKLQIKDETKSKLEEIQSEGSSKDTLITLTASSKSNSQHTEIVKNKDVSESLPPTYTPIYPDISEYNMSLEGNQTVPTPSVVPTPITNVDTNTTALVKEVTELFDSRAPGVMDQTLEGNQTVSIPSVVPTPTTNVSTNAAELVEEVTELPDSKTSDVMGQTLESNQTGVVPIPTTNVSADATELVKKVTELLDSGTPSAKDQIVVLCNNTIKSGFNAYEIIDDLKVLKALASGFLSVKNPEKAKEIAEAAEKICGKIVKISQDEYNLIWDSKVLNLLAKEYYELGLYNNCIESCKKSYECNKIASEEHYQILKEIADKTTSPDIQLAALNAAKNQTNDLKQKGELSFSRAKILLSLGNNNTEATNECENAACYNPSIYKNLDEETLKSIYDKTKNSVAGYIYFSNHNNHNFGNQALAEKFKEIGYNILLTIGHSGTALCAMKAFLCSHDRAILDSGLWGMGLSSPYYTNYAKIPHNDFNQLDNYCRTLIGELESDMYSGIHLN